MSNFGFLRSTLPGSFEDCARAESYLASDPRSACFYGRRAVECLVNHLYAILRLEIPYRNDLHAKINDAAFVAKVDIAIRRKIDLIRTIANKAVHENRPLRPDNAPTVLHELFHVMVWAAFRYSANPQAVPTRASFDPALAAKAAPLSRAELAQLAQKFKAQDEAHAKALAERDDLVAARDAEIAALREQIAAAQAANNKVDDHDYNEAETRDRYIDVYLGEAGWPLTDTCDREYEVTGMPNNQGKGYIDYVLWGTDGLPLAVVEAKRTMRSPHEGQQQAKLYADSLEARFRRRPVIFYTNGYEHWLWDDAGGYPPREVQGFYTRDELELQIQRRTTRLPLATATVNTDIAGRPYQVRAIKAVGDAFDRKQRQALLVMATGSGKTRTVIALIDQLMKANWIKRALFLADRTALVNQAVNAFKANLPAATTVNLVTEKATDARVYVSTYPTMMNIINDIDGELRKFGPGYFDLIVIDEAHRSVYQKYGAIFDWFDSLLVGLTATPKDEVDHNTYRLFHLEDGVPTDAYNLDEAVAEGYLVPPVGVSVGTKFSHHGIRYADLTDEERDQWDSLDWGDDGAPDEVTSEELNRFLFNEDTVDKVLTQLMTDGYKVESADRLGKTIIFAKNKDHAQFIQRRFDIAYPEYRGEFARVITHGISYAQSLIDDFSVPHKAPHIAISVDMLDTGIDVPDVVNLVFFKQVRSKSKFWQMIGRGTRLRPGLFGPDQDKQNFLVFDYCGNLEYFSQNLPSTEGSTQKSLNQRLFEARLNTLTALDDEERQLRKSLSATLHEIVSGMNLQNFLVRPHRKWVERYSDRGAWASLTVEATAEIADHLAALPSAVSDNDEDAKRFDLLILRRQLAQLEGDGIVAERFREQIQNIAANLLSQTTIPPVKAQELLLEEVANEQWWVDVTLPMLELARVRLRGLLRFLEKAKKARVYTDFQDALNAKTLVEFAPSRTGMNWERFVDKTRQYLREHEDHVALQRLRRNKQLTPDDLTALESMLVASGASEDEVERAKDKSTSLGLFIRSLVGLDREAAMEAFGTYLDGSRFDVQQIRFVNLIVEELTDTGIMEPRRLFESPFTDTAPAGPDDLFPADDVDQIVNILDGVKARAIVDAGVVA